MKRKEWKECLRSWYHFASKSANSIEITMQIENIHYSRQSLQEGNIVIQTESRQNIDQTLITQFQDLRTIEISWNESWVETKWMQMINAMKLLSARWDRDMSVESSQRNIDNDNSLFRQNRTSLLRKRQQRALERIHINHEKSRIFFRSSTLDEKEKKRERKNLFLYTRD